MKKEAEEKWYKFEDLSFLPNMTVETGDVEINVPVAVAPSFSLRYHTFLSLSKWCISTILFRHGSDVALQ